LFTKGKEKKETDQDNEEVRLRNIITNFDDWLLTYRARISSCFEIIEDLLAFGADIEGLGKGDPPPPLALITCGYMTLLNELKTT
jgi:hypothetical protein